MFTYPKNCVIINKYKNTIIMYYYNLIRDNGWKWGVYMKARTMIMIAAICFAIIPMIVYAVYSSISVSGNGKEEFIRQMNNLVQNQQQTINTYLDTVQSELDYIKGVDVVRKVSDSTANKDAAGDFIVRMVAENPAIDSIVIVGSDDKVICGKEPSVSVVDYAALDNYKDGVLYIGDSASKKLFIKSKVGSNTLVVFYKIEQDAFLCKVPANGVFYTKGTLMVVDSRNNYISASSTGTNLVVQYADAVVNELNTLGDGDISEPIIFDGASNGFAAVEKKVAVIGKVGGEDGFAVIASCHENMAGNISGSVSSSVVVAVVIISIICIAGAIFIAINVTQPLKTIEETLVKIRRGDHDARIATVSNNEYGQISRRFNNLVDEIVVSEDRYRTITEMSDNIIFEWNFKTNEVFFSNNFNKKFSYRAPSDHFADSFLLKAKIHGDDSERYKEDLEKLGNGEEFKGNEYRMKNIYGDFIWVLVRTATLRDKEGNPLKIVGVMVDIDRAKKSEQQLTERASYDALTELYNRETVESHIDNEISLSEARKAEMAVLFVDVDDFKHFNDQYSHATGDQVLKFVARTIQSVVGEFGFAGRYGGDEFIACIRNAEINDPAKAAQEMITRLDEGFESETGERLRVSVSIGIALIKDDYNTRVEYLIGKADDAMYSVKKSGKSNYAFI